MNKKTEKQTILEALRAWVNQRPGLQFVNYGDVKAYNEEARSIRRDKTHALTLLAAVAVEEGITGEDMKKAFSAYSGRLSWDGEELDYCTGQYWPTEYRRAACAVLASALWHYRRSELQRAGDCDGNTLRAYFRKEFGRGIASRWFD